MYFIAGQAEQGGGVGSGKMGAGVTKLKFWGGIFCSELFFHSIAMDAVKRFAAAAAVIDELKRMRSLGYFVVDEAFEFALDFDEPDLAGLSVSSLAFIACERGYAEYKSRLRSSGTIA